MVSSITELSRGQSLAGYGQRGWTGTLAVTADDRRFSTSIDRGAVIDASSPLATDAAVRVALIAQPITSTKVSEIVLALR